VSFAGLFADVFFLVNSHAARLRPSCSLDVFWGTVCGYVCALLCAFVDVLGMFLGKFKVEGPVKTQVCCSLFFVLCGVQFAVAQICPVQKETTPLIFPSVCDISMQGS
jgi:hypothetical protein